jgi:tRNA U34 5-carboxymethylaminomethyl modifying GTPase MnmE/TrmE
MPVSAVTGEGVQELAEAIGSRLVLSPPPANVGLPFRQRHQETLTAALRSLEAGNPDEARTCLDLLAAGDFARDD